jgi:hypothetical protein
VTFLALVTSIALIGTTAQALRDYSSATKIQSPNSDPLAFDLRATQLTLACGIYIAVGSLGFLIVAFALWVSAPQPAIDVRFLRRLSQRSNKPTHPPTRHRLLHPTLFTLVTLPALFLALFTLAYNISTSNSSITSTSGTPALNYASCYYSSLAHIAPFSSAPPSADPSIFSNARRLARNAGPVLEPRKVDPPAMADLADSDTLVNTFAGICAESRVSQVLLLMVVMLEMAGSVVVVWGWWAALRGNGKRGVWGDARGGRRGRRARGETRRVWKGVERV